jgi:hypothetical protein
VESQLGYNLLSWMQPQERPAILGRTTYWGWGIQDREPRVSLRLGIDIYNASDAKPAQNTLEWTGVPSGSGWQVDPHKQNVRELATYHVLRSAIDAQVDPDRIRRADARPLEITLRRDGPRKPRR